MLTNIAIGAILILLTTAVHASGMSLAFRLIRNYATVAGSRLHLGRVFEVGRVVLIMYLVAIVEVLLWGAAMWFWTAAGACSLRSKPSTASSCSAGRLRSSSPLCNAFIPARRPTDMI